MIMIDQPIPGGADDLQDDHAIGGTSQPEAEGRHEEDSVNLRAKNYEHGEAHQQGPTQFCHGDRGT